MQHVLGIAFAVVVVTVLAVPLAFVTGAILRPIAPELDKKKPGVVRCVRMMFNAHIAGGLLAVGLGAFGLVRGIDFGEAAELDANAIFDGFDPIAAAAHIAAGALVLLVYFRGSTNAGNLRVLATGVVLMAIGVALQQGLGYAVLTLFEDAVNNAAGGAEPAGARR